MPIVIIGSDPITCVIWVLSLLVRGNQGLYSCNKYLCELKIFQTLFQTLMIPKGIRQRRSLPAWSLDSSNARGGGRILRSTCVCSVTQSCPALCDPMDCSLPGSSVHGTFQARILEWVARPSSRGSSQPRDWTHVSCVSCIGRLILYTAPSVGKPNKQCQSTQWEVHRKSLNKVGAVPLRRSDWAETWKSWREVVPEKGNSQ